MLSLIFLDSNAGPPVVACSFIGANPIVGSKSAPPICFLPKLPWTTFDAGLSRVFSTPLPISAGCLVRVEGEYVLVGLVTTGAGCVVVVAGAGTSTGLGSATGVGILKIVADGLAAGAVGVTAVGCTDGVCVGTATGAGATAVGDALTLACKSAIFVSCSSLAAFAFSNSLFALTI